MNAGSTADGLLKRLDLSLCWIVLAFAVVGGSSSLPRGMEAITCFIIFVVAEPSSRTDTILPC